MHTQTDRRAFLLQQGAVVIGIAGAAALAQPGGSATPAAGKGGDKDKAAGEKGWPGFQQQDPALVREMVGASHGRIDRVKELVRGHPALAKAAWDWGFGDWETALGAASHVGNREIAAVLLENGARLDIFAAAMLGMTEVVRSILTAQPLLATTRGPHGISLLAHATAGKNEELIAYLKGIKGAGDDAASPIKPEEMQTYLGTYSRDGGAGDVLVTQSKFGMMIKAQGGAERGLTRTGEHTFHPAGAPNVRVVFTVQGGTALRVEVSEAEWMVSAVRGK